MMANVNSYPTVSDGLAAIIRAFEKNRTTGLVMTRRDLATFLEGLQALQEAALLVETIADRVQWNENARRDNARARRDVLEAGIAEGTVTVFPVVARRTAQGEGGDAA